MELCEKAAAGCPESRRLAWELHEALTVLSTYDEGPDLVLYYKYLMVLEGNPEYAHHFNPSDALSPSQQEFIRTQWQLFRAWWSGWNKA